MFSPIKKTRTSLIEYVSRYRSHTNLTEMINDGQEALSSEAEEVLNILSIIKTEQFNYFSYKQKDSVDFILKNLSHLENRLQTSLDTIQEEEKELIEQVLI